MIFILLLFFLLWNSGSGDDIPWLPVSLICCCCSITEGTLKRNVKFITVFRFRPQRDKASFHVRLQYESTVNTEDSNLANLEFHLKKARNDRSYLRCTS